MVTKALLVRLEALPGKEAELGKFLEGARAIVMGEPGTTAWFALQIGPSTFGVFDVFPDDEARDAHLAGGVGQALGPNTGVLFPNPRSRRSTSSRTSCRSEQAVGALAQCAKRSCLRGHSEAPGVDDEQERGSRPLLFVLCGRVVGVDRDACLPAGAGAAVTSGTCRSRTYSPPVP